MMSQPASAASAPRLAPPRRNSRRVGCGISFAASLISSPGSMPGGAFRMRDMVLVSLRLNLPPDDHGAQALRHQDRHHHVHDQEADNRGHRQEMDIARS